VAPERPGIGLDVDEIRQHARTLGQLDHGQDVRRRDLERLVERLVADLERVQRAPSLRLDPADVPRVATRAGDARIPEHVAAGAALRQHQLLLAQAVPVRLGLRRHRIRQRAIDLHGAPLGGRSSFTALTKARKLVENDRVHMLAGVILSNVAYALVPYIEAQGIPTIYPINSADDLTQRKRPKWLIRTGFSAGGNMHPFGEYAARTLGYRK